MPGTLYIVATPIGNLEDITFRAIRILKEVALIAAEDTRHTQKLLNHFEIQTPLTSFFEQNEMRKMNSILARLATGDSVALVSDAGTPGISDPGFKLIRQAVAENIPVVPIPGASALLTALSAAGLPTDRFTFIGFLPDKPGKRRHAIEAIKSISNTLVFYVSPWKASKTLADLADILGPKPAVIARELTKLHEEWIRGSLTDLAAIAAQKEWKGELTLVVGGFDSC